MPTDSTAPRLVEQPRGQAFWDDLMYAISVRQGVDRGIAHAGDGRVLTYDDATRVLGLGYRQIGGS